MSLAYAAGMPDGLPRSLMRRCLGVAISGWLVTAAVLVLTVSAYANESEFGLWLKDQPFAIEHVYLRVNVGGRAVRLETIILKRMDARGRLPIALFNHGRPDNKYEALEQQLFHEGAGYARDLADRGWLAVAVGRRGFGASDGPIQADNKMPCGRDLFTSWMNADADEIQAALEAITKRPDADPTRVIALGISAGGAASVALGARNPPGLKAVINVAGGENLSNCPAEPFIPADFTDYGSRGRVPNLWFFAQNDRRHPPPQVELMRGAFSNGGGNIKLVMLDPIGNDGHLAVSSAAGRNKWLPEMDKFLRALNLPTWRPQDVDILMRRMKYNDRAYLEGYMSAATNKVLVRATTNWDISLYRTDPMIDNARKAAMSACQIKAPRCEIVMENDRWAGPQ